MEMTFSRDELARMFGVGPQYISRLVRDGVLPRPAGRRFPASAVAAYWAHLDASPSLPSASLKADTERFRAEIARHRAHLLMMKADLMEGLVEPVEKVIDRWCAAASRVRQKLLSMPTRLAPHVAVDTNPLAVEARIRAEVEDALREFDGAAVVFSTSGTAHR